MPTADRLIATTIAELATHLSRSSRMVSEYLATGMREVCEVPGGYDVRAAIEWMGRNLQIRNAPSCGPKSKMLRTPRYPQLPSVAVSTTRQFEQEYEVPIWDLLDYLSHHLVERAIVAINSMPPGDVRDLCERQLNQTLAINLIHHFDRRMTLPLTPEEFGAMRERGHIEVCDKKYNVPFPPEE